MASVPTKILDVPVALYHQIIVSTSKNDCKVHVFCEKATKLVTNDLTILTLCI